MCKKFWILTLMISICMMTACAKPYLHDRHMDIYEKLHRYYGEMKSYSATVHITAYSNKTQNTYTAFQKAAEPGRSYAKMLLPDSALCVTTVEKNGMVKTFSEGTDYAVTLPSSAHTGLLFVNRFFQKYYASESTVLTVSGGTKGNVTVLETELSENNPRICSARLSVDNQTLAPVEIVLIDQLGNAVLKGEFSDFIYNDTFDQSIFSTEE